MIKVYYKGYKIAELNIDQAKEFISKLNSSERYLKEYIEIHNSVDIMLGSTIDIKV